MLPKTPPNYQQYKIHKRWLLSWIHFIVIIRVTTFECFKMQMVINLAPVSLSNKKVNFYTCPRLTFLKKNATENAYKSISEPLDFKIFLRGACPQTPLAARAFGDRNLLRLVLTSGYGPDLSLVLKYRVELLTTVHCKPPLYKVQEDNYNLYFP